MYPAPGFPRVAGAYLLNLSESLRFVKRSVRYTAARQNRNRVCPVTSRTNPMSSKRNMFR